MPRKEKYSESSESESQYNPEEDDDDIDSFSRELNEDSDSERNGGNGENDVGNEEDDDASGKKATANSKLNGFLKQEPVDDEGNDIDTNNGNRNQRLSRKRRKVIVVNEDELLLPTSARKTNRGGYAHTTITRARISKANAGNVPWNYGKHRSSADKARIAAGVRARNRAVLLGTLKRLGMSEAEWATTKKEVTYMREKIRRTRCANKIKKTKGCYNDLLREHVKDHIMNSKDGNFEIVVHENSEEEEEEQENDKPPDPITDPSKHIKDNVHEEDDRIGSLFPREINWTPFALSDKDPKATYDDTCPTGGPGGLICCEGCSQKYSSMLTRTMNDLESHRLYREMDEVKELSQYLGDSQRELCHAVENASPNPFPFFNRVSHSTDDSSSKFS